MTYSCQYVLWCFHRHYSPALSHQLQSPAQLDHFRQVFPDPLTGDPSPTTSIPDASYANALHNHSIKKIFCADNISPKLKIKSGPALLVTFQ